MVCNVLSLKLIKNAYGVEIEKKVLYIHLKIKHCSEICLVLLNPTYTILHILYPIASEIDLYRYSHVWELVPQAFNPALYNKIPKITKRNYKAHPKHNKQTNLNSSMLHIISYFWFLTTDCGNSTVNRFKTNWLINDKIIAKPVQVFS